MANKAFFKRKNLGDNQDFKIDYKDVKFLSRYISEKGNRENKQNNRILFSQQSAGLLHLDLQICRSCFSKKKKHTGWCAFLFGGTGQI